MKIEKVKSILGVEDVLLVSPEAINIQFNVLQSKLNRQLKLICHEEKDSIRLARFSDISLNLGTNIIYELITPNNNRVCFAMRGSMFGVQTTIGFDRSKYFQIVKELKKLTKHEFSDKQRDTDFPILPKEIIDSVMRDSIQYLDNLSKFKHLNLKGCRGLIFMGPPGNGKTMLCRYLAKLAYNAGYTVQNYSGMQIDVAYQKGTLSQLFSSHNIIFFDDVDINYFSRKVNGKQSCSLLSAMDGLVRGSNCIRIFSTNEHINDMDSAFLRPGRIDKIYKFDKPTSALREMFIKDWANDELKLDNVSEVVERTNDFSFAELAELRNELLLTKLVYNTFDLNNTLNLMSTKKIDKKLGF